MVSVAAPSQGKAGSTPTSVSPLGQESGTLGHSPHCVSLGSSMAFSGPQSVYLRREDVLSPPPTSVDVDLLICQTWGCVSIIPTRAHASIVSWDSQRLAQTLIRFCHFLNSLQPHLLICSCATGPLPELCTCFYALPPSASNQPPLFIRVSE